jgi:threonine dehydrogenase-like Zn-dependent dehydrogenase
VQPTGHDRVLKLPADAYPDPWHYVPIEVSAISWRGVSMAAPLPGETAVVVGQGVIGAFSARWLQVCGARVVAVDLSDQRLQRAKDWGMATVNAGRDDARQRIDALLDHGADIVVEASASMAGCRLASKLVKDAEPHRLLGGYLVGAPPRWPRLVLQASYTERMEMGPGGLVSGEGAAVLRPRDRTVADRLAVMERIRRRELAAADFVDRPTPVSEAPRVYAELAERQRFAAAFAWQG